MNALPIQHQTVSSESEIKAALKLPWETTKQIRRRWWQGIIAFFETMGRRLAEADAEISNRKKQNEEHHSKYFYFTHRM
jgi:hypothetical protein